MVRCASKVTPRFRTVSQWRRQQTAADNVKKLQKQKLVSKCMMHTNWLILSDKFTSEICYTVTDGLQQFPKQLSYTVMNWQRQIVFNDEFCKRIINVSLAPANKSSSFHDWLSLQARKCFAVPICFQISPMLPCAIIKSYVHTMQKACESLTFERQIIFGLKSLGNLISFKHVTPPFNNCNNSTHYTYMNT